MMCVSGFFMIIQFLIELLVFLIYDLLPIYTQNLLNN